MTLIMWLTLGLLAFDTMLLIVSYFALRKSTPMSRQALIATGAGLSGFVFHAFLFFSGPFLVLQLATIAGIFCICIWAPCEVVDGEKL
ncbi:MAG: hypothetical protein C0483_24045 [Pirellula sp.]|nr:hypothetical protein [Pirellula sp.]